MFIEAPESVAEMERIGRTFDAPLLANLVEGGRTPVLPKRDLEAIGYKIAIFPAAGFLAAGAALRAVYSALSETGSTAGYEGPLYDFSDFTKLMGFERVWAFERANAEG
ncbi:MAG TPA: hypothetical protein VM434_03070 [Beijerinckiaceae bacterium]|nr:hypothetical protein [Beijerinckiaceae bacterium]